MKTKHLIISTAIAVLASFALPAIAECEDDEHGAINIRHELLAANSHAGDHDNGNRNDNDNGNRQDNDNSNRQSDAGSTRGQERAAERHADKNNHDSKDYGPWYNPRGLLERARDNPWYNPLGLFN